MEHVRVLLGAACLFFGGCAANPESIQPTATTQVATNTPLVGDPPAPAPPSVAHAASATFADGEAAYEKADYKTALAAWQPLADKGDADAQHALGIMYLHGYGVAPDPDQAVKWLTKSCLQGNVHACDALGAMYEQGKHIRQDKIRAYVWYSRAVAVASEKDSPLPKSNLSRVTAHLTPAEIAQANALAANLLH